MKKADARKMTDQQLFDVRKLVVELHRQQIPIMRIVEESGLSWPAVKTAIKRFEKDGIEALRPKKRGKKEGTGRRLTPEQEIEICNILYRKRPWRVGLRCPISSRRLILWNRELVKRLIHQKYGTLLSERGLANYLRRWGFPTQKKHEGNRQRCSRDVQRWLRENKEFLSQQQDKNFIDIFWISRKTITVIEPLQDEQNRSGKLTMASMIDRSGKEHWLVFGSSFTSKNQISFVKAIRTWSKKKPLLIRDKMSNFKGISELITEGKAEICPPLIPSEKKRQSKTRDYIFDFDPSQLEPWATF